MENRIDINSLQPNTYKAMFGLERYISGTTLDAFTKSTVSYLIL